MVRILGLVQGVGFRPFIYRLAVRHGIHGWVENRSDGVLIHAEAGKDMVLAFIAAIRAEAPEASQIRSIENKPGQWQGHTDFFIRKSSDSPGEITEISPDIAVCSQCLEDMKHQPHRAGYAFVNCTNCGPRFTIISDLPYDRVNTTMDVFEMCPVCRSEYEDILDRRFHAQPVACNHCGPHYSMVLREGMIEKIDEILDAAAGEIGNGHIIAIKGLGGFHLACNAFDETACRELRRRKNRDGKPFAVMFRDFGSLALFLEADESERIALLSWRRPIVILKNRPGRPGLAFSVSNGFKTTGAMLPYMPFHHLLFEKLSTPAIVLTSGNISDEPVLIDYDAAALDLNEVAHSFITYNRRILNRTDDSVLMVAGGKERIIRRSRGYVPAPVELGLEAEGIFAAGAELVNCFCIGKGRQAILSQHIGDLKNLETLTFFEEAAARFARMFRFTPALFATDMHPDYLSTRYCLQTIDKHPGTVVTEVQHHHAHIASCMAEHGLDETVIGVSLDGVGYGTDGNTWGFELMTCDLADFTRRLHPEYVAQPGGDLATREPWRMAVAYLMKLFGEDLFALPVAFLAKESPDSIQMAVSMVKKGINSPLTCSAGRLFDAVGALTGICIRSDFHAEAPMRLEQAIAPGYHGHYDFAIHGNILLDAMIAGIVEDLKKGAGAPLISARFHNTICQILLEGCNQIREETGLHKVVLSGGTFQNRYILTRTEQMLKSERFICFSQEKIPTNDGGIALGQLAVAAKRRMNQII